MSILNEYYMYLLYIMYLTIIRFIFIFFVQHQLVSFEYEFLSKSI